MENEAPIDILLIDEGVADEQIRRVQNLRATRDNARARTTLQKLREAAATDQVNLMPYILNCVRTYATLGEICDELRAVYGTYEEPAF